MNRREFIKCSAISGIIAAYPSVTLIADVIVVTPSGSDDTESINAALRASARIGDPVMLANGKFIISNSIVVPSGGRIIGQRQASPIIYKGDNTGVVISIEEPYPKDAVRQLFIEDRRSPIPFLAMIGN